MALSGADEQSRNLSDIPKDAGDDSASTIVEVDACADLKDPKPESTGSL